MNFDILIDDVLTEGAAPQLDLQRYKLYIDLNDQYLRFVMRGEKIDDKKAKMNIDTLDHVLLRCHNDIYHDLSEKEVGKIKNLFRNDFLEKKNTEIALGGLKSFAEHYREKNDT